MIFKLNNTFKLYLTNINFYFIKANVNIADLDGWTPLHISAYCQRANICYLLLKKKANPFFKNRDGFNPYELAQDEKTKEVFNKIFEKENMNIDKKISLYTREIKTKRNASFKENFNNQQNNPNDEYSSRYYDNNYVQNEVYNNIYEENLDQFSGRKHKFYLHFKKMKSKINLNNSVHSISVSSENSYIDNYKLLLGQKFESVEKKNAEKVSIFDIPEEKNTDRNEEKIKIIIQNAQTIPFKLNNIYNSVFEVRKDLHFQNQNNENNLYSFNNYF